MNRESSAPLKFQAQQEKASLAVRNRPGHGEREMVPARLMGGLAAHVCRCRWASAGLKPLELRPRHHAGNDASSELGARLLLRLRSPEEFSKHTGLAQQGVSQRQNPHRGLFFSGLPYLLDLRPVGKAFLLTLTSCEPLLLPRNRHQGLGNSE